ncbi:stage V sporulation protein AA [Melghiribacillus thermohalophilus]|uniref:Stage V sporulation protein AA n=1 Tax=Melghiribacillus thermohalophilus TaxID=1324956 RepID=A0A4R3NBA0_9BACI|nr:stage V sporulation protein AA [Melghiribacillus thermohalophilus]TCT25639.1 stage V sporulation protein AA [Melghiribacillus thermohalophilus]
MGDVVYIRLKNYIKATEKQKLMLKDIAYITGNSKFIPRLKHTFIYQLKSSDQKYIVMDIFTVITELHEQFPNIEFQPVGPNQTIVEIERRKRQPNLLAVTGIWILLFVGSGMAIMNFHYDVSMQEVQQKLHYMLTGEQQKFPLWIQIPYSIGLGLGMILFFNHVFKKRFNEEPSPLEVEMFNYEQDLNQYVIMKENKVGHKDDHP